MSMTSAPVNRGSPFTAFANTHTAKSATATPIDTNATFST